MHYYDLTWLKSELIMDVLVDARMQLHGSAIALQRVNAIPLLIHQLEILRRITPSNTIYICCLEKDYHAFEHILTSNAFSAIELTTKYITDKSKFVISANTVYVATKLKRLYRTTKTFDELAQDKLQQLSIMHVTEPDDLLRAGEFLHRSKALPASRYIHMPIARKIALSLKNSSVQPNHITSINILLSIALFIMLAYGRYSTDVLAVLCMNVIWILDLSDGYLARLKHCNSKFGMWYDTITDEFIALCLFLGLVFNTIECYGLLPYGVISIWLVIFFFVISMDNWIKQALLPSTTDKKVYATPASPTYTPNQTAKKLYRALIYFTRGQDMKYFIICFGLLLSIKKLLLIYLFCFNGLLCAVMLYKTYNQLNNTSMGDSVNV